MIAELAFERAGTIVMACVAVVVIFVVMVVSAIVWSKQGMFPTKGWAGGAMPLGRRRRERWNRELGWGDVGDDEPAGPDDTPKTAKREVGNNCTD